MPRFNNASYPPLGQWDHRLSEVACAELQPVECLHDNKWFSLRKRGGYFTIEYHLRQVVVLPIVDEDSVVLVRANRPVLGDMTIELPAGAIEDGEDAAAGAARELAEETGIEIADLRRFVPMPPIAVSPNRIPKLTFIF